MDVFLEKIITRKKTNMDYLLMGALFTIWLFISIFIMFLFRVGFLIDIMLLIGLVYLLKGRNVEYEYAVTNGELDIDKIVAQRKRTRIFSANCKDFDIIAKVKHEKFNEVKSIEKRIVATSSKYSPDIYFIVIHYKEARTLVLFEPDERMLKAFKTYIPRKVLD